MAPNLCFENHHKVNLSSAKVNINRIGFKFICCNHVPLSTKSICSKAVQRATVCYAPQICGYREYNAVKKTFSFFVTIFLDLPINTPNYAVYFETGLDKLYWSFILNIYLGFLLFKIMEYLKYWLSRWPKLISPGKQIGQKYGVRLSKSLQP